MDEYIERGALREAFDNADADVVEEYEDGDCDWGFGRQNILEVINSVPSADVATVRHGNWEWDTEDIYRCSNCAEKSRVKEVMGRPAWGYCPNCGAMMEGGSDG